MCRLAWQLLGMLGNVLGHPRRALQRPRRASRKVLGVPHRRKTPPLAVLYWNLVVHYSFGFTAYKAASGGVFFDVGLLRPCKKCMPRTSRTLPSMPKSYQASLYILGSHRTSLRTLLMTFYFFEFIIGATLNSIIN